MATTTSICTASPLAHPTLTLDKRIADLGAANIVKIKGNGAPAGPLYLIFGGLSVAFVAFIFAIVKVLLPGKLSSSGRRLMEERERARSDLRVRGGGSRQGSTMVTTDSPMMSPLASSVVSRGPFADPNRQLLLPPSGRMSGGKHAHISSTLSRPSISTGANSLSSMVDVPMLGAHDGAYTAFSSDSLSSGEGYKNAAAMAAAAVGSSSYVAFAGQHSGTRRPALPHRESTNRSSTVYRGTDLNLSRKPSTKSQTVTAAPAWVDASQQRDTGLPRGQQGGMSSIHRFTSDSPDQSRRNSSSNLLDDVSASLSPHDITSPFSATSSSSGHSSNQLQLTKVHPLSNQKRPSAANASTSFVDYSSRTQTSDRSSHAPPQWHRSGKYQPSVAPRDGFFYPNSASSPSSYRALERDSNANSDQAAPGSIRQPVAKGNGRRGIRGSIVGGGRR